jgi:putative transposase
LALPGCGLSLRHCRPRRNKPARLRQPKQRARAINEIWSMDFVTDAPFDGRRLRALPVVDTYTPESAWLSKLDRA